MSRIAGLIIASAGAAGLFIASYNYVSPVGFLSPLSNTSGTLGALVPIGSTIILVIAGLILASQKGKPWMVTLCAGLAIVDILGTGSAAILLDSDPLLVAMMLAAIGWLVWLARRLGQPCGDVVTK